MKVADADLRIQPFGLQQIGLIAKLEATVDLLADISKWISAFMPKRSKVSFRKASKR